MKVTPFLCKHLHKCWKQITARSIGFVYLNAIIYRKYKGQLEM